MSIYWKARTLISGDYRELERNWIQYHNQKVIEKYKGKEEIYCVTRLFSDEGGLFCLFLKGLAGISYSLQNGYIPVIDMQTKENIFVDEKDRKNINAWEYFFEQPAGVRFQDIKHKKNKIILENPAGPNDLFELLIADNRITEYWRTLCRKHIRYTEAVAKEIERYSKLFGEEDKFLGVIARGTDYLNPGAGHPVQPSVEDVITRTSELLGRYNCNKIFLATEDTLILNAMLEEFGERVNYVNQKRYAGAQNGKLGQLQDYKSAAIDMNISYLAAMYLLTKCDCFFGGITTGTTGVYLLAEKFEHFEVWYNGKFEEDDIKSLDINKL